MWISNPSCSEGRNVMLAIIISNIKQFITTYRLIFVLFIISQLVSTLSIMFVYSVVVSQQKEERDYNQRIRTFTVEPMTGFDRLLDRKLYEIMDEKNDFIRDITVKLGDTVNIHAKFTYPSSSPFYVSYGKYFTEEDFLRGVKQVILSDRLTEGQKKVGDTFTINNREYEIIGMFSGAHYHEIPYKSIEDYNSISLIEIVLEEVPNKKDVEQWREYLHGKFPDAIIAVPEVQNLQYVAVNLYRSVSSIFIGLLAVLNFSYLYRYILLKRRGQYASLRICGCSIFKGALIYLSEVLFLSITQFGFSSIIFQAAIFPLSSNFHENLKYMLSPGDYLFLFAVYLTVILLVFTPIIIGFSRQKPVELWRKNFA
jgi:hypothetical protein